MIMDKQILSDDIEMDEQDNHQKRCEDAEDKDEDGKEYIVIIC